MMEQVLVFAGVGVGDGLQVGSRQGSARDRNPNLVRLTHVAHVAGALDGRESRADASIEQQGDRFTLHFFEDAVELIQVDAAEANDVGANGVEPERRDQRAESGCDTCAPRDDDFATAQSPRKDDDP